MTDLRVPPSHRRPLVRLASMDDADYDRVKACFLRVEGDLSTSAVVSQLGATFESSGEAESVLDALIGASLFGHSTDPGLESAATEIVESDNLKLEPGQRELLGARLTELFQSPVLELFAKAVSLRAEDERSYCASRILTDLRPIFSQEESTEPLAALIQHTLKFDVHINGRVESILISIDSRGLTELATAIARAARKAVSMAGIARSANLQLVEFEEASQ